MRTLTAILLATTLAVSPAFAATKKTSHVKAKTEKTAVVEVSPIYDPIEPFNRAVFQFNRFVDYILLKPVTKAYTYVTPTPVQHGVTNFLSNLGEPIDMLNATLQGNWNGLGNSFRRLVINSTVGVLGFSDVATRSGIDKVDADFGQTLGKWGAGHGFYLVLPIIGPSSVRDGAGRVVDTFADPYNIVFMDSETEWPIWARYGLTTVDTRARLGDEYDRTMKTAVDPYVTFRSIYAQHRAYVVQSAGGKAGKSSVDAYSAAEAQ